MMEICDFLFLEGEKSLKKLKHSSNSGAYTQFILELNILMVQLAYFMYEGSVFISLWKWKGANS